MKKLVDTLSHIMPRKLYYCDVGARGGIEYPWRIFRDLLSLICFEPDKEECDTLNNNNIYDDKILPYAVHSENKEISINLTKLRACSSGYTPNKNFLKHFPEIDRYKIEKTIIAEGVSLDHLYNTEEFTNIDFIKIDVQGAALNVLKGGKKCLSNNVVGIEVEVEFKEIYENQDLFSSVDMYIRDNIDVQIQDISKNYWKYPDGINIGSSKGQLIFADVLYFRSAVNFIAWCEKFSIEEARNKIIMAFIMGIIYGYLDYSLCILNNPNIEKYLDKGIVEKLKKILLSYGKSLRYNGVGRFHLYELFNFIASIFRPSYSGWAARGDVLGARKNFHVFHTGRRP